jgi:exodeoxyribonuclease VII small subunit
MTRKAQPAPVPETHFEQSLQALEGLVNQLERGDLPLAEALTVFEKGVALTRSCHTALAAAQQRVEILLKDGSVEKFDATSARE